MNKKNIKKFLFFIFIFNCTILYSNENIELDIMKKPIEGFKINFIITRNYQSYNFITNNDIAKRYSNVSGVYENINFEKENHIIDKNDEKNENTINTIDYYMKKATDLGYEIIYITDKDLTIKKDKNWIYYFSNNGYYEIHSIEEKEFNKNLEMDFTMKNGIESISKINGFTRKKLIENNFKTYNFIINNEKANFIFKPVKGKYYEVFYEKIDKDGKIDYKFCYEEIIKNFKVEAFEKKAEILYEKDDEIVLNKDKIWMYINSGNGMYNLIITKEIEFEKKLYFENEKSIFETTIKDFKISNYKKYDNYVENYFLGGNSYRRVKGNKSEYLYEKLTEDGINDIEFSWEEILENYKYALQKLNADIVYEENNKILFKLKNFWIDIYAETGKYKIEIMEEISFVNNPYKGESEIKKELNEKGYILLEAFKFEYNKNNLNINAVKQLNEIVKILKNKNLNKIQIIYIENKENDIYEYNVEKTENICRYLELFGENRNKSNLTIISKDTIIDSNIVKEGLFLKIGE